MVRVTEYEELSAQILDLADSDDPATAAAAVLSLAETIHGENLEAPEQAALRFMCSSLAINAASDLGDVSLLEAAIVQAELGLEAVSPGQPLFFQLQYNIANATVTICDLGFPTDALREEWEPKLIDNRAANRERLRTVRTQFFEIGTSDVADAQTRSSALCNLANMLDHSGRWAEAYDFYLRALDAHPENGNAAGNLAQLLAARIQSGVGQAGHIAAVYDMYVALAKELREGTIEFASATVADKWDQLVETESLGHLSHGIDDANAVDIEYRLWVAENRLALSPAVEGLGTDDARWDSATIERLYGVTSGDMNPRIFGEINVLKSDFLVARRLAFEGEIAVLDGLEQAPEDSGLYVDTLDYSLYGTQYSKLLLAQRSALDVLDKTAVVANEHFKVGDTPRKIHFRGFWADAQASLRPRLVKGPGRALPAFALAELAYDMENAGMYADSQALRNAGTHRIVHAALLDPTGVTEESRSTIGIFHLLDSTILALQVTRSAFLYLVDLVAAWNQPEDHQGTYVEIPTAFYMDAPTFEDALASEADEGDTPTTGVGPA